MEKIDVSRDMISALPSDLLINILLFVSTKDAVATMILSKRWRFVWTMVPKLEYEDTDDDCDRLSRFLDKSLELHNAPVLDSLFICLGKNRPIDVDVEKCVSNAVDRFVRKLKVDHLWTTEPNSLPKSLYICTTLVELTLWGNILVDVPPSPCMPSLKMLRLFYVIYKDEDSLVRLLSSCPLLDRSIFEISLSDWSRNPLMMKTNISSSNKPHIFLLCYAHDKILRSCFLLKSLTLYLSDPMAVNFTGITFSRLLVLTLRNFGHHLLDLLALILHNSPGLRFLRFISPEAWPYLTGSLPLSWSQPSYVPQCLSYRLQIFEWREYSGSEGDKQLMRYILANSKCLKIARIIFPTFLLEEKEMMEKELNAMPRVSTMSQLLFE